MKKIIILSVLLALSLFSFNCGGGSGSSSSPKGENPGEPSIVQLLPAQFIAQTNSIITLHAKVLDGNGAPVNNISVSFTNLSPIGLLSAITAKTNSTGIASVTLKSTASGFSTVQAEINKGVSQVRDRKTVYFATSLNLQPYMILDVDGDNDGIYNEASDLILFETATDNQVMIRATVFNVFGQRAAFTSVTFGSDSSEASFPLGSIKTTDANGEAFVLVQVDPIAIRNLETVLNITAVADNGAVGMVSLFLKPVTIQTINISANPQTVDSGGTSTITAQVLTRAGTPVPDGTSVNFTTNLGGIDPFSQTTDGIAEATFTAPTLEAGASNQTAHITASAGGESDTVNVTIVAPEPEPEPEPEPAALTVLPTARTVDGITGGPVQFRIDGGVASYSVSSSNSAIACNSTDTDCSDITDTGFWTVNTSGVTFIVTIPAGTAASTVNITVRDSAGTTVTATITITAIALSVQPPSATVAPGGSAGYTIIGGTGPYSVVTSHPGITTISAVTPTTTGGTFTVSDTFVCGADTTVTITVIDYVGTTKTADYKIDCP